MTGCSMAPKMLWLTSSFNTAPRHPPSSPASSGSFSLESNRKQVPSSDSANLECTHQAAAWCSQYHLQSPSPARRPLNQLSMEWSVSRGPSQRNPHESCAIALRKAASRRVVLERMAVNTLKRGFGSPIKDPTYALAPPGWPGPRQVDQTWSLRVWGCRGCVGWTCVLVCGKSDEAATCDVHTYTRLNIGTYTRLNAHLERSTLAPCSCQRWWSSARLTPSFTQKSSST